MFYKIVVVSPSIRPVDHAVLDSFDENFIRQAHTHREYEAYPNKLIVFTVKGKNLSPKKILDFEQSLDRAGYTKLYATTCDQVTDIDARFFTIDLNQQHFSDMKNLLVKKFEKAIGRKLAVYENIYYLYLTKKEVKAGQLCNTLDIYMSNPAVEIIICL